MDRLSHEQILSAMSQHGVQLPAGLLGDLEMSQVHRIFNNTRIEGNSRVHMGDAYNCYINMVHQQCFHQLSAEQGAANVRKALYYCTIDDRKAEILRAKPETLSWIWTTSFGAWLENSAAPVFWVSGKPASGKSTLMKYLITHGETTRRLSSTGGSWVLIHFFFDFQAGTGISNSRLGLVRSMLIQLVNKFPQHAEVVYSGDLSQLEGNLPNLTENLENALQTIIEKVGKGIVAFIDGLDEYKGDLPDLVRYLLDLAQIGKLKICLASRPEVLIAKFLDPYPGIVMQEWNVRVVHSYYEVAAQGLLDIADVERIGKKFLPGIARKADGVLLWAKYVIDQIIQNSAKGQTDSEVEIAFNEVPPKLDSIYQRVLDRMPSIQKAQAALFLAILTRSETESDRPNLQSLARRSGDVALLHLDLVHMLWLTGLRKCNMGFQPDDVLSSSSFRFRVHAMFDGFVEFSENKARIHRFHKTFGDYLARTEWTIEHLPSQLSSIPLTLFPAVLAAEVITEISASINVTEHRNALTSFPFKQYHGTGDTERQTQILRSFLNIILPNVEHQIGSLIYAMQYLPFRIPDLDRAWDNPSVRIPLGENLKCLLSRFYPNRIWRWEQRSYRIGWTEISLTRRLSDIESFSFENNCLFNAVQFSAVNFFFETFPNLATRLSSEEIHILTWLSLEQKPREGLSRLILPRVLEFIDVESRHVCLLMSGELDDVYDEEQLPPWFQQLDKVITSPSWQGEVSKNFPIVLSAWVQGNTKSPKAYELRLNKILEFTTSKTMLNACLSSAAWNYLSRGELNRLHKIKLLLEAGAEVSEKIISTAQNQYDRFRKDDERKVEFHKILNILREYHDRS